MEREIQLDGRKVTVVGTSHVSGDSAKEVETVIEREDPDLVAVELDETRYQSLTGDSAWQDLDLAEAIREGKGFLLFTNIILAIYQRQMGLEQEKPGTDMLAAINAAEDKGINVALVDRDLNETMRRAREELSMTEKLKLMYSLLAAGEEMDAEELENGDIVDMLVEELAEEYPSLSLTFLEERNEYMAEKLLEEEFDNAVLVVGAAHLDGVCKRIKDRSIELPAPAKRFPWGKVFQYGLPLVILGSLTATFTLVGFQQALNAAASFIIINGLFAFIGALLAKAHPLNVVGSTLAAPYTAIDPFLGAGMISGYLEARLRPPKISDMEELSQLTRYRDLYGNRAGKVVLAFFFVTMASALGTVVSVPFVIQYLPF